MTSGIRVAKTVFLFLKRFATVPEKHLVEVWVRLSKSPLKFFFRSIRLLFFRSGKNKVAVWGKLLNCLEYINGILRPIPFFFFFFI